MAPPAINDNSNTNTNQQGIFDQARDFVHEKVATDEQLQQEKPMDKKIQEAIPKDPKDAVDKVGNVLQNTKQDIQEKFNERLDEGTERAQKQHEQQQADSQNVLDSLQDKVYEATKSPSVQEREEFQQADLTEKLDMLQSKEDDKKKDTIPPATLLS